MARRKTTPQPPAGDQTLLNFTTDFFHLFGAQVTTGGPPHAPVLAVELPAELSEHFGRPHLALYFHGAEPQPGEELVAHGSRTFDRMLALLEQRSAFTLLRLPPRVRSGEALLAALRPVNATIRDLRVAEQPQWLFVFHWRLTYRADDKRQELFSIVVDGEGRRVPLVGEGPTGSPAVAAGSPAVAAGSPAVPAGAIDLAQLLADGEAPPLEINEEGHPLPPKLPPLRDLTSLALAARRYAIYHADLRCVAHEAEILPRLHKALNRLKGYYQQQIEEVYDSHDPDGEKRRALEADLNRKIAEEVENHRLHVEVELIAYVALERPAAVLQMTVTDGKVAAPVRVVQDRYSGAIQRPACDACGAPLGAVAIDQGGHLICDNCIEQCRTCGELLCARCGIENCPVCGGQNCATCGHTCSACGGRACATHLSRCPTCGDEVCHACQSACSACGVRMCRSHLYADSVLAPPDAAGENAAPAVALICPTCAVRCGGCRQYTVQLGICAISGQQFCRNCLVTCAACGCSVGPGFYAVSPVDRKPYCRSCQHECPTCGRLAPITVACAKCGMLGCPLCRPRCSVCREPLCAEHSRRMPGCEHILCAAHVGVCAIGGEAVCRACYADCAICSRPHCADHTRTCVQCAREYCSECVRANGRCDTCATVAKEGAPEDFTAVAWPLEGEVQKLIPHYSWRALRNARYTIYFGEGALFNAAVIVVEHAPGPAHVVHARRISVVDRMRGMAGA